MQARGPEEKNFPKKLKKKVYLTIILRPKLAKLGVKWRFGEFSKSKHTKM